ATELGKSITALRDRFSRCAHAAPSGRGKYHGIDWKFRAFPSHSDVFSAEHIFETRSTTSARAQTKGITRRPLHSITTALRRQPFSTTNRSIVRKISSSKSCNTGKETP